jgi:superfamily II DNA/RNA helicase
MLDSFQRLEDDPSAIDDVKDLVIATSTISHGVDLETLNYMIFFGMPRRTSEYIQSSSRVGRKYPGIVVDVFHPIRERDRSHYHYFNKYHQYLDRLVEPVPVNRWAKFSIDRTLPGMFMAMILQHFYSDIYNSAGSPYLTENVKSASSRGILTNDQLNQKIGEIYGRDRRGRHVFEDEINDKISTYMTGISNNQSRFTGDSLPEGERAMFSLRDVDEPVNIFADRDEGRIVDNLRSGNGGGN